MWLEVKKYLFELAFKEVGPKKIWTFQNLKEHWLRAFQLELLEEQMIHNMFNEDLLIQCKGPQFKGQHIELASPPDIIYKKEEYEVEEIRNYRK